MDLREFLLARIAEEEAVARGAIVDLLVDERDGISDAWQISYSSMNLWPSHLAHITRHDPARVLAQCEAKRQIVEALQRALTQEPLTVDEHWDAPPLEIACEFLALPYADHPDHPDYQPEWKP